MKTALRAKKLREIGKYVDSASAGSALRLLEQIKSDSRDNETENSLAYETKIVNRHNFFILCALIFLILSFVDSSCFVGVASIAKTVKKRL